MNGNGSHPPETNVTPDAGEQNEPGGALTVGTRAAIVVEDSARNVQSLPAIRGPRNLAGLREQVTVVLDQIASGTRTRMKKEQLRKLNAAVVFMYWQAKFEHPGALLDDKREKCIVARLAENDDNVSELLYALDGASHDPFVKGTSKNSDGRPCDKITWLLKDREQIERFASTRKSYLRGEEHRMLRDLRKIVETDGEP